MSNGIYGSALVRREYETALEINNIIYEKTFEIRRIALAERNVSRVQTLTQALARTEELGVRLKWKIDDKKYKGGNK